MNFRKMLIAISLSFLTVLPMGVHSKAINRKGGYSQNDIRVISGLKEKHIRDLLPTNMKQLAPTLYKIENSDKPINALFLIGVTRLESDNGRSNAYRNRNNVGGIMGRNGLRYFNSKEESLLNMQDFLYRGYVNKNIIGVRNIGRKYCTTRGWFEQVNAIAKQSMYKSWSFEE